MFAYRGGSRPRVEVTAGGLALLGLGGLVGYQAADMLDRKLAGQQVPAAGATSTFKLPTGVTSIAQYDDLIVSAKPSMGRIGAQLGLAALGFAGGALLPWAAIKMLAYGFGFGAFFHAGGQLITQWIVAPMFQTNNVPSANGVEMYAHEFNANALINPPAATTTTTTPAATPGTGSGPPRVGAPVAAAPALPIAQPIARMPHALTRAANALGQTPLKGGASTLTNVPSPPQPQPPIGVKGTTPAPQPPVSTQQAPNPPTGGGGGGNGGGGSAPCGPSCGCATCSAVYAEDNADRRMGAPPPPSEDGPHPLWAALIENRAA